MIEKVKEEPVIEKKLEDYDMSTDAAMFKKFSDTLYETRVYNYTNPDDADVYPHRLGSLFFYEANNKTK